MSPFFFIGLVSSYPAFMQDLLVLHEGITQFYPKAVWSKGSPILLQLVSSQIGCEQMRSFLCCEATHPQIGPCRVPPNTTVVMCFREGMCFIFCFFYQLRRRLPPTPPACEAAHTRSVWATSPFAYVLQQAKAESEKKTQEHANKILLKKSSTRGGKKQKMKNETWNMKHETWKMKHETWKIKDPPTLLFHKRDQRSFMFALGPWPLEGVPLTFAFSPKKCLRVFLLRGIGCGSLTNLCELGKNQNIIA